MPFLMVAGGQLIQIDARAARQSQVISDFMDNFDNFETGEPMPLQQFSYDVINEVVDYLEHLHEGDQWKGPFYKRNELNVVHLAAAADYLIIEPLLQECAIFIGTLLRGHSPDDLRRALGIENDLTPEMEQEMSWIQRPVRCPPFVSGYIDLQLPAIALCLLNLSVSWAFGWLKEAFLTTTVGCLVIQYWTGCSPLYQYRAYVNPWPLMTLSDNVLHCIFRYLRVDDRLCSRLNQRLFKLERAQQYTHAVLMIGDAMPADQAILHFNPEYARFTVPLDRPVSLISGLLRHLQKTETFETIRFTYATGYRAVIPIVKQMRARALIVHMEESVGVVEITDATLPSWLDGHEDIVIAQGGEGVTGDALFDVYTRIITGSSRLLRFRMNVTPEAVTLMLRRMGINYQNVAGVAARITATNRQMKFFEWRDELVIIVRRRVQLQITWPALGRLFIHPMAMTERTLTIRMLDGLVDKPNLPVAILSEGRNDNIEAEPLPVEYI